MSIVSSNTLSSDLDHCGFATRGVRAGQQRTAEREHSEPIFTTSSFIFDSAEQAAQLFADEVVGNVYSRFTNPTVNAFESKLGALENADYCVATSSGMAAITGLLLSHLRPGDHVIASYEMFGSTISLLTKVFERLGISITLVTVDDPSAWQNVISTKTRILLLESPTNPLGKVADIPALAEIAHKANALLVVDNCFCTPVLQQPISLGADVVVHTATKYLDGQGRCVGGAMATNSESIHEQFFSMLRTTGPCMSPFNAWVFLKGLETLELRMHQHCKNAGNLATWLTRHLKVKQVYYAGLADHVGHRLASRQQKGFGGIVSFRICGGKKAAWKLIDATKLFSITANLGDVKTTITHPASTTHARISQQQRDQAGISDSLIRISVGIENIEDIIADLNQALDQT